MTDIPIEFAILSPAIIPIVKAIRMAGLPDKFLPIAALLVGLLASGVVLGATGASLIPALAGGLLAGAGAVGIHQTGSQLNEGE